MAPPAVVRLSGRISKPRANVARLVSSARSPTLPPPWIGDALHRAPAHTAALAWLTSVASTWAYADAKTFTSTMKICLGNETETTTLAAQNCGILIDTQANFLRNAPLGLGMLVFRGTQFGKSVIDLFTDMAVAPVAFMPGKTKAMVHGGFYRGIACTWHESLDVLEKNRDMRHLLITGHSLGGALAVLATAMLFSDLDRELDATEGVSDIARNALNPEQKNVHIGDTLWDRFRGLYTFGQPMVGDRKFAELCADFENPRSATFTGTTGSLRFRHGPRATSTTSGLSTSHVAMAGVPAAGSAMPWTVASGGVALAAFLANQFPLARRWLRFPYSLADHMPQNYVDVSKRNEKHAPALFP